MESMRDTKRIMEREIKKGSTPLQFDGLLIGIATFLIIGLFHPVVVKAEYQYCFWGER